MSDWTYDGKKFHLIDDDDVMDAPLTDEDVISVFDRLFLEHDKYLPPSFELTYEGGDRYTLKPRNPKSPFAYFKSLTLDIVESDDCYSVAIVPDRYVKIVSLCPAFGMSREDGPEGFADLKDYGLLEEHLQSITDSSALEFIIKKSKI